ncbi:type VI secretion system-associated protein TagF [Azotobacter vinelandii]
MGWYGKIPAAGDFVMRQLPYPLLRAWERWMQSGLNALRQQGAQMLSQHYAVAPAWNFLLPAGLGCDAVQLGCLAPSHDRVGRHYPLAAILGVPPAEFDNALLEGAAPFYRQVGEAILGAVRQGLSVEQLSDRLAAVPGDWRGAAAAWRCRRHPRRAGARSRRPGPGLAGTVAVLRRPRRDRFLVDPPGRRRAPADPHPQRRTGRCAVRPPVRSSTGGRIVMTHSLHTNPAQMVAAQPLPAGHRMGELEITGVLGIGGFGIVYRAFDHALQRVVAVKEYMPAMLAVRGSDLTVSLRGERYSATFQAGQAGFINEARLLAQFDHPCLIKVLRFWEEHGTAYMATPFYEGQTLEQRLAGGRALAEGEILRLLAELLGALETLHRAQCFHRDIALDNILIQPDGRPVLLDFGAARKLIGDLMDDSTIMLKPGYAPIEQYTDDPSLRQGPWTDIYALGAVIHVLVSGELPPAAVVRSIQDNYLPLAGRALGYGQALLQAVDGALQLSIKDRPPRTWPRSPRCWACRRSRRGSTACPIPPAGRPAAASGRSGDPAAGARDAAANGAGARAERAGRAAAGGTGAARRVFAAPAGLGRGLAGDRRHRLRPAAPGRRDAAGAERAAAARRRRRTGRGRGARRGAPSPTPDAAG